jgi:hypothetical protein
LDSILKFTIKVKLVCFKKIFSEPPSTSPSRAQTVFTDSKNNNDTVMQRKEGVKKRRGQEKKGHYVASLVML